jgi:hypothetical protein
MSGEVAIAKKNPRLPVYLSPPLGMYEVYLRACLGNK